jgi:hypothetical protein
VEGPLPNREQLPQNSQQLDTSLYRSLTRRTVLRDGHHYVRRTKIIPVPCVHVNVIYKRRVRVITCLPITCDVI